MITLPQSPRSSGAAAAGHARRGVLTDRKYDFAGFKKI